jgi:2-polyprenyl-3-methyl-5-hydroxy-6-metoxy-1,4-benzoquinol methylase
MICDTIESKKGISMDLSHSHPFIELTNERLMRTAAQPKCILCGSEGQIIYSDQKDRLFGTDGSWDFKICPSRNCGLIWLDPMPAKEDIAKAYARYYTHTMRGQTGQAGLLKRIYRLMKRGYWVGKYNYPARFGSFAVRMLGKILYLFPIRRSETDAEARLLKAIPEGRLLDVGCGSGEWLVTMCELGWRVEGIDFDEDAVGVAKQKGLDVRCGTLEQQNFPDGIFDAVTLNHVIEHLPDPKRTILECARILKPDGKLVIFTPNSSSLGHKVFQQNWRGLEPPRHLYLFSMQSLRSLLERNGFKNISVHPQIAKSVIYESVLLRRGQLNSFPMSHRIWLAEIFARLFNIGEICLSNWKPSVADCVAAVAEK